MAKHAKTLAEFFGVEKLDFQLMQESGVIAQTAFVTVDVQEGFAQCADDSKRKKQLDQDVNGSPLTEKIAEKIANATPNFRQAGFPIIHVFTTNEENLKNNTPYDYCGHFYKLSLQDGDILYPKKDWSAFTNKEATNTIWPSFQTTLDNNRIRNVIITGLYTSMCIKETVCDALSKKFNVCVLEDMTTDEIDFKKEHHLETMQTAGAFICHSTDFSPILKVT